MISTEEKLCLLGLNIYNSVLVGSAILNILNIRESKDLDIIVDEESYNRLKCDIRFKSIRKYGLDYLQYDEFEIGTGWNITEIGKIYLFDELVGNSTIISGVRYISLDFILFIKRIFTSGKNPREKDITDVYLIEEYLKSK